MTPLTHRIARVKRRAIRGRREALKRTYGPDPKTWPGWGCVLCGQSNAGWSVECGRCGVVRGRA